MGRDASEAVSQTVSLGAPAGVSRAESLQPLVGAQDSFSVTFFRKLRVGSMTLIKQHVNARLSCLNGDIPDN